MNSDMDFDEDLGIFHPTEADDPGGFRLDLQNALKKNNSSKVVISYIFCVTHDVPISEQMKEDVICHLPMAYKEFVQRDIDSCIYAVKSLRHRFDHADEDWDESGFVERVLEMRCEVAVLESLYGNKIKEQVQQLDDVLKTVSDLFGFVKNPKQIEEWRKVMQKLGVKDWWLEI